MVVRHQGVDPGLIPIVLTAEVQTYRERKGRREPCCTACRGSGDPKRPVFNDPLSRKRRGEDD